MKTTPICNFNTIKRTILDTSPINDLQIIINKRAHKIEQKR